MAVGIAIDPQIAGVYDDGTNYGAVRTRLISGELVRQPFIAPYFQTLTSGTGTSVVHGDYIPYNPDGTGYFLNCTVEHDVNRTGSYVAITWVFRGTVLGVRWLRDSASTLADCSLVVDGQAFYVNTQDARNRFELPTALESEGYFAVFDLPDGEHTAQLVITADLFAKRTLFLLGYIVERRAGYTDPTPRVKRTSVATVPTTAAAILNYSSTYPYTSFHSVRKIIVTNTNPIGSLVYTLYDGAADAAHTIAPYTVTAGEEVEIDFTGLMAVGAHSGGANLWHGTTATGLNYTLIGD